MLRLKDFLDYSNGVAVNLYSVVYVFAISARHDCGDRYLTLKAFIKNKLIALFQSFNGKC